MRALRSVTIKRPWNVISRLYVSRNARKRWSAENMRFIVRCFEISGDIIWNIKKYCLWIIDWLAGWLTDWWVDWLIQLNSIQFNSNQLNSIIVLRSWYYTVVLEKFVLLLLFTYHQDNHCYHLNCVCCVILTVIQTSNIICIIYEYLCCIIMSMYGCIAYYLELIRSLWKYGDSC